jgi:hypothetical protein
MAGALTRMMGRTPAAGGGGPGYRYHRWSFTSATGIVQFYEIRAYETWGGSNVYLSKTVTASDQSSGAASNAVDGNASSTFWATTTTPSPQTFTVDAGAGNHFNPLMFSQIPRTFSANQTNHSVKIEGSDDNSTWTTLIDIATLAETVAGEERQFTAGGDDASGYRYYWFKDTGNNFAGASVAYLQELTLVGPNAEDLALQNIAFVGSVATNQHAHAIGDYSTNDASFTINDTIGVDLGRKRTTPVSVQLKFSNDNLLRQHGPKQWEFYGSNTNSIGSATLLKSVNDVSGTPAANEVRTYTI